ncbi:MAG: exo-alpha-sialidase [Phycisphaeraceae bacterium]|nr:exo-alpha-sialidase [Phycisphaeraceae bacterium]
MSVLLNCGFALAQSPDVQHVIVYANPAEFAGWPANEGLWQWGDEILVGFEVSAYSEHGDNHNVDREAAKRIAFARSLDGGLTWTPEEHLEIAPPEYLGDPSRYVQKREGVAEPSPSPGGFNFVDPDFAMKVRGSTFYVSSDRGHHWQGPYELPHFDMKILTARTNYLAVDAATCRLFFSASNTTVDQGEYGRTMMAETADGGKTFQRIAWLTPDPRQLQPGAEPDVTPAYTLMPSVVKLEDGTILAAMRDRVGRHKWNHLVASTDNGRTWEDRGVIVDNNNNPIALVSLGGQRLAAAYGYRGLPYGIRGKISEDGGRTWSPEYILRDDGREWDLGYPRAAVRSDGRIVIVYYYTTEQIPPNHIAATIWNPRNTPATPAKAQE